jgi:hypothetical protein
VNRPPSGYRAARGLSVAVAGLFAGHMLVYRILAPNALQRALLLAQTGHAYLPTAVGAGAALAAAGIIGTFLVAFQRGGSAHGPGRHDRAMGLLRALVLPAIAQAAAFVILETLERVLAGAPLSGLLGPLLPLGVALQLVVGALGGLVLFGIDCAGEQAGRWAAGRAPVLKRHRLAATLPAQPARTPRSALAAAFGIRGPPPPARA